MNEMVKQNVMTRRKKTKNKYYFFIHAYNQYMHYSKINQH